MFKKLLMLLFTGLLINFATPASAAKLTFDEFNLSDSYKSLNSLNSNYGGFQWSSYSYLIDKDFGKNKSGHIDNGYNKGAVSGENSFFNSYNNEITISRNENFDFIGANFTSLYSGNNSITIFGYRGVATILVKNIILNTDMTPKYFELNFKNIDKITLITLGSSFVMDDFNYNLPAPVPEPSSMLLGFLGLGGLFGFKRKK